MRSFDPSKVPHIEVNHDVSQLWSRPNLDLEIGCGQGLHAIQYCLAHPDRTLIAIERTHEKFSKALSRFQRHNSPDNLMLLQADAVAFAVHYVPEQVLKRIFLLYPNPYPKRKQANQRWHNSSWMGFLLQRLRPNGELILATNLKWYAEEAKDRLTNQWGLSFDTERTIQGERQLGRTHFERKYLERGETCYEMIFRRLP
jgi:tRNA (guanine-N7-)-methyltransferase